MAARFGVGVFRLDGEDPRVGLVVGDHVTDLARASARLLGHPLRAALPWLELMRRWDAELPRLQHVADAMASEHGEAILRGERLLVPLEAATALPPLDPASAVFCAGANYRAHVQQLALAEARRKTPGLDEQALRAGVDRWLDQRVASGRPYVFLKLARVAIGAADALVLPRDVEQADFELELAVVIGQGGYRIPRARALEHVAGYTIANDVSARERIARSDAGPLGSDWLAGKCSPTFLPLGPMLVPRAHAGAPGELRLQLSLNGEPRQDACASDLLFDLPRLIEHVSSITELQPGDVILTGSPEGNGAWHGRFLAPGDVLDSTITGLGRQRTRCVAEGAER